jgi:hypothetical protein
MVGNAFDLFDQLIVLDGRVKPVRQMSFCRYKLSVNTGTFALTAGLRQNIRESHKALNL